MVGVREVVMLRYIPKSDNHRMARQMDAAEHPTFAGIWLQFVLPPKRRPNDRAKNVKPAIDLTTPGRSSRSTGLTFTLPFRSGPKLWSQGCSTFRQTVENRRETATVGGMDQRPGRMISVRHTMEPVLNRTKTVSRDGWWERKNGTRQLVVGQRLKALRPDNGPRGRSPIVVGIVHVGSVTREPLGEITDADVARVPHMTAIEFVKFYTTTFRVEPDLVLTRIGWSYAPDSLPSRM